MMFVTGFLCGLAVIPVGLLIVCVIAAIVEE